MNAVELNQNRFYVYGLFHSGVPFYIGKGTGDRIRQHDREARRGVDYPVYRKIRKLNYTHESRILQEGLTSEDALELEELTINTVGRRDLGTGSLLNLSDGGIGRKNCIHTPEARAKLSESLLGHTVSQETRDKISATKQVTPITRKQREVYAANGRMSKGRKHTDKTRAKISTTKRGHKVSQATRDKISATLKAKAKAKSKSK